MKRNSRPGSSFALSALFLGALAVPHSSAAQEKVQLPTDPYRAVVELEANAAVADGHPVLVADGKGKPMAGVSVVVVDTRAVSRARRREVLNAGNAKYGGDAEATQLALLALHGKRYVTDEKGATKFARVSRGMVVAIRGRTIAVTNVFLRSGREPRQIRLTLQPKPGLDVVVVDHRGRPVRGVPVRLIWRRENSSSWGEEKTSGAGGRVRLQPLSTRHTSHMIPYVEARVPTKKRLSVKLDPETFVNDPDDPIKLQLPPFGMVRVYVVDDKKRPVKKVDAVYLRSTDNFGDRETFTVLDPEGDSATFPIVEVGLEFEAWCQYKGMTRPQRVRSDGPRHPMDMRVVTLEGVTAPRAITFRLLDQKGEPVENETVGAIMAIPDYYQANTVKTGKDGLCRLTLTDRFAECEEGYLTITRRGAGRDLVYRGAARVALENAAKKGSLGELRLVDEKLLVAGRVVDKDGKPVEGVFLSVPHGYKLQNRGGSSTSGDSKFHRHQMRTDKDGRFEFREFEADPVSVTINLDSWFPTKKNYYIVSGKDADPGAKDHTVVVGLTSKLSGMFKGLPKDTSFPGNIELQDKDGIRVNNLWVQNQSGGVFEVPRCPPGEYKLAFKLPGAQKAFLTVENIKVEEGKPCKDPRLQGIDLTKHCKLITVTVLRPDKTPASGTTVWQMTVKDGRAQSAHGRSTDAKGVITLCVPPEGTHLAITPRDGIYRTENLANQKEDLTITLKPGWRAKFKIKNMPELPNPLRFRTSVYHSGGGANWGMGLSPSRRTSYIDEKGEVELGIGSPGKYRLTLYPDFGRSNRRVNRRANLQFEIEIKKDAKGVQDFDLELDEASLEEVNEYIEIAKENEKGK